MTLRKTLKAAPWIGGLILAATLSSTAFAHNGMMGGNGQPGTNADSQAPANPQVAPYGYGPGMMMYGYGPGAMMYGYGPMMGNGYGPGGMRGYGPGMMSGYGYGMHGYGMHGYGPGMMYGYGPGAGRGVGRGFELDAKQRQALNKLWQSQADQQQQLYQDMSQMQDLMAQENPDPAAVGKIYDRMAKARRQMLLNGLEMRKQFENTLTPQQRMRWRQSGPWCPGNGSQDNDD